MAAKDRIEPVALNEVKRTDFTDFITREEFARRFHITVQHAAVMAHKGEGPKVTRLGKRAFYHLDDIAAWLDAQREKANARFGQRKAA